MYINLLDKLKAKIEQHRVAIGVQGTCMSLECACICSYILEGVVDQDTFLLYTGLTSDSPTQGPDMKEEELRSKLETEKARYSECVSYF